MEIDEEKVEPLALADAGGLCAADTVGGGIRFDGMGADHSRLSQHCNENGGDFMRNNRLPGKLGHGLAILATFLLTVVLSVGCITWQVREVATDEELHTSIALNERVQAAQMERIEGAVQGLAEQYHFSPDTVMDIVTPEAVAQYNRDVIAWWMQLLADDPATDAPEWDASEVEAAVREDALFQENTPSTQRRSVARDGVAYEVGRAVTKAVLPVRATLLSLALPMALERIDVPRYMHLVNIAPRVCALAAAALCAILVVLMRRRVSKALMYVGSALAATALILIGCVLAVWSLGLTAMVGEVSSLLAMQLDLLGGHILLQAAVVTAVCLAAGCALIAVHQHDMKRFLRGQRSAAA